MFASPAFAQNNLNCDDFDSQAEAQATLEADRSDPNILDADGDGRACETFDYGDDNPSGDDSAAADQYADDGQYDDEDGDDIIIRETVPKKPLPNTGGVPLTGVALLGGALLAAGGSILWHGTRRD